MDMANFRELLKSTKGQIRVYGTPAAPVATAGQPLFAPSTARFGGPRQIQLGLRANF